MGTTFADLVDRSLGIGYWVGSALLAALLATSLAVWRWSEGTVLVETVTTPRVEAFYWTTILFSQTLGTALGDWMADASHIGVHLGFGGGALVFGAALAGLVAFYYYTNISRVALFCAAFILTRPLGATVGDFLDKAHQLGGLGLSRYYASAVLIVAILVLLITFPQRAGAHPSAREAS